MEEVTPRNHQELEKAYNLGLADLNGERDGVLARMWSGHNRRLGQLGPICWALLPASVLVHRGTGT